MPKCILRVSKRLYSLFDEAGGVALGDPEASQYIQIISNTIQNTAQGLDMQCDNVIISGNIVYDSGRDILLENGKAVVEPPRCDYVVKISLKKGGPVGLHFSNTPLPP